LLPLMVLLLPVCLLPVVLLLLLPVFVLPVVLAVNVVAVALMAIVDQLAHLRNLGLHRLEESSVSGELLISVSKQKIKAEKKNRTTS
jgi:hypothetical protein